jgi:hypothetical protein
VRLKRPEAIEATPVDTLRRGATQSAPGGRLLVSLRPSTPSETTTDPAFETASDPFERAEPLEAGREPDADGATLEVAADGAAVDKAYSAIKAMMDSGNFQAAVEALKKLPAGVLRDVLEKILGSAGNTTKSVTVQQLTDMLQGGLKQIPKAAAEAMRAARGFKAGAWNPKPKEDPGMYIGNTVHAAIARAYVGANFADRVVTNQTPIKSILQKEFAKDFKGLSDREQRLMPDIVNVTQKHLYEIKPESQVANAVIERDLYWGVFQAAGVNVARGPQTAPGVNGVVEAPGGHALYYSPLPGVILYRMKRGDFDPANLPLPSGALRDEKAEDTPSNTTRPPVPALATEANESSPVIEELERLTGLTGVALLLYLIVSEGSRIVFPPRNLIPLP